MKRQNFNAGWSINDHFDFTKLSTEMEKMTFLPNEPVHLPHDYMILTQRNENAPGGWGTGYYTMSSKKYEKTFFAPEEWRGKQVLVEFEGAYHCAIVKLNNNYVGKRPNGYSNFFVDLTKFLKYGQENKLKIILKNHGAYNSRWYPGSGLYRNVNLYISNMLHIQPEGVKISTPEVGEDVSEVLIQTEICSKKEGYRKIRLLTTLYDADGNQVGEESSPAMIENGESVTLRQHVYIRNAKLWSLEEPNLYYAKSNLYDGDELIDEAENHFGIRKIQIDPVYGFRLNGKPVEIRGGAFHHDNGVIGACAFARAEERKVELFKKAGFTAMRSAHNPCSRALLDAADRIGMLIVDESFDQWNVEKMEHDYSNYFEEWWEKDTRAMVDKDYNHPCVISYSVGNEIGERDGTSDGGKWCRRQAEFVRSIDPTRPVNSAICGVIQEGGDTAEFMLALATAEPHRMDNVMASVSDNDFGTLTEDYAAALDLVGYNYMYFNYDGDLKRFPNRIICGTESVAMKIADIWKAVRRNPAVIGDFSWTGMDYIGEVGCGKIDYSGKKRTMFAGYPWILANCGDIDINGGRRPQSYYKETVWGTYRKPYIAVGRPEYYGQTPDATGWSWHDVISSWSFPGFEGKPVKVSVYSNADEVELFLNGKSIGKASVGEVNDWIAWFELTYEPGELKAVSYRDGKTAESYTLTTCGKPASIRLNADRLEIVAGAEDLSYIEVTLADESGAFVPYAKDKVKITVEGAGTLQGSGNADPQTDENYYDNVHALYDGKMLAVIRSGEEPGTIRVTASCQGLPDHVLELTCK